MVAPHDLTTSFGATLLGTFFSAILYGLTVHQTYRYYRQYTIDRASLKLLVLALWVFDTLQTVLSMHTSYSFLVNHFGEPETLLYSNWSFRLSILVVAGPPFLSNAFYVSRLWIIGMRNYIFLALMGALMLTRTTFQLILAAMAWKYPLISDFRRYFWMVRAYCGASLVADILLAVFFCWTLHKRRTGYARTDSKIDLLMIYSINTGSLTSLVCLLSLMSLVFLDTGFVYIALHYLLGKLYVNSVLAVLNSRKPRHKLDDSIYELAAFDSKASHQSGKIQFRRTTDAQGSPIDIQGMIRIHQTTSTHVDSALESGQSDSTLQNTDKIELEKA
ncbi:hypothetical protein DFP72DRAFT_208153 [Ephemerocybe angulata]|uniref:DUF6534 domain-containing protein n=1 Tax=Ephemerocybe angulata TaxID=980116 RepID=A0A8H6I372_9AGAR|nr:hypothetical protein DFP72DRAFT_208153 [Tulosesus angulatus]